MRVDPENTVLERFASVYFDKSDSAAPILKLRTSGDATQDGMLAALVITFINTRSLGG